ncbi:PucR family transcriptional regulator [Nesterenkonia muleiensis]|uniref:PucR family transcriptional regulator n=1 Tax=Nesterenkonia muleiensis TaxID=2282648 RepID=UPI000E742BD5|nr:PucR family transcriptional regulator [Nesterenkonia muleiensis]
MKLQELLDARQLRIRTLYSVDGAPEREVNWTYTTDLLDPGRYLSRGQLVMTGMVWRRNPGDSDAFVGRVANAGAIALFAGEGLLGYVPDDVVAACHRHRLPLFSVPAEVSFASITAFVSDALASKRVDHLAAGLIRQRDLLTDVYRGQMLDELITRSADDLGRAVWVITASGRQVVLSPTPLSQNETAALLHEAISSDQSPFTFADSRGEPISALMITGTGEHQATGWFLVVSGDWRQWHPTVLDTVRELAAVVGLYRVQHRGSLRDSTNASANRLVQLIAGDHEGPELAVYRRHAGMEDSDQFYVLAGAFDRNSRDDLQDLAFWVLADAAEHVPGTIVATEAEEHVIVILPAKSIDAPPYVGAEPVQVFTKALTLLATTCTELGTLQVGISASAGSHQLGGALRIARYCLQLAAAETEPTTSLVIRDSTSTMSSTMLLAAVPDPLRRVFVDSIMKDLIAHDARYRGELVATLRTFLDCDCSWVRTAEAMHLHVNSLRYRIARVEKITNKDLSNNADRTDLYLALKLM